jgi:hypothetical protein
MDQLIRLDNAIQDLLDYRGYTADLETCEEYIDSAKREFLKATLEIESRLASSGEKLNLAEVSSASMTVRPPLTHSVKLFPIKLEPFAGDLEMCSQFWEQFESSIYKDPTLTTINKHVFLRGYLESEPKLLVDGISVIATTYEETKNILHALYVNKNRIIQAHLEEIKPFSGGAEYRLYRMQPLHPSPSPTLRRCQWLW